MKTVLKKCSFKGIGKLSKLFDIVLWGHEQASGVLDLSEQISAGSHPSLNKFPQVSDPSKPIFVDFSNTCSAGSDTPVNKFPQGLTPLETNFRRV
jgi:hypothetical protein